MSNILNVLSQISSVKKTEVVLPIAKLQAMVNPLTVGDDVTLKTSVLSPANIDMELTKLIYKHTEFIKPQIEDSVEPEDSGEEIKRGPGRPPKKNPEQEGVKVYKPSFNDFLSKISHIDKLMLMWGIYKATFDTLGTRTLVCSNCKIEYDEEINLDDLIQEDSLTFLEDEKSPFTEYEDLITIPYENWVLEFTVRLPSMKNHNNLLSFIPIDTIQNNLENIKSTFDSTQMMALFTKKLSIYPANDPKKRTETVNLQEILSAIEMHVKLPISNKFMEEYNKLFGDYMINFYKPVKCPSCSNEEKYIVDMEFEFFRGSLSGGE